MRILLTGPSLSHRNQGDNLLYFVVGEIIRRHYDGRVELIAFSSTPDPERITAQAPWLRIVNPRRNPLLALRTLLTADAYLIAGAIPFHDRFWLMLQQLCYAGVVKLRGGRFIVNAVSIQPIASRSCRLIFRLTQRLADSFTVRDSSSLEQARRLGAHPEPARAVDPGFMLQPAAADVVDRLWRAEGLPLGEKACGLGPHLFVNHGRYADARYAFGIEYAEFTDAALDAYYDGMAEVADWLAERGPVVFFALSTRMPPGDDRLASEWIVQRMRRPERAFIVRNEYGASELMGLLGRLDLYVSTRLHGYALAAGAGVPSIAVEFHPKMRGLAQELGIECWVAPFLGISGAGVIALCESILRDLDASRRQLQAGLRSAAERSTRQLEAALPSPGPTSRAES